ncbi:unnamed protein product [Linum trigynum]|uniref:Uncharacterized protein n=1 Tax=Linum trigynum TaxID=586398 RepID=A0AAV2EZ92_9ROSI
MLFSAPPSSASTRLPECNMKWSFFSTSRPYWTWSEVPDDIRSPAPPLPKRRQHPPCTHHHLCPSGPPGQLRPHIYPCRCLLMGHSDRTQINT